ncbi:MAG: hypothetical protein K1X66_01570 [Verrucomicrobiae bacterium]|nr:hypothetical protein [Verrucomicrobiae bacterium]
MKHKNLHLIALTLSMVMVGASSRAYELVPCSKDTSIRNNSIFVRGASSSVKIIAHKSQAYLEFPLNNAIASSPKINLVLQTKGIRRAKNLTALEVTGTWNERSLVAPHGVGPVRSIAIPMPKRGVLKLDVTDLVKSQAAAGKSSINLALSLDRGALQVMARESGLGAQLEFCGNSGGSTYNNGTTIVNNNITNITPDTGILDINATVNINSNINLNGSVKIGDLTINKLLKVNVHIEPPPILGGILWSTVIPNITQPGDIILSVNGFGLTDNLLPLVEVNAQGDLQIGIKNLNLLNILNVTPKDLTICILR